MSKQRHNFTLSSDTVSKLKEVENKSDTVDKAVSFYLANQNKTPEIVEIEQKGASFRLKRVIS